MVVVMKVVVMMMTMMAVMKMAVMMAVMIVTAPTEAMKAAAHFPLCARAVGVAARAAQWQRGDQVEPPPPPAAPSPRGTA